tara:strand:- start:195 stop:362 length:168 start_codon:yes stop_codon:yes gene_type:complete
LFIEENFTMFGLPLEDVFFGGPGSCTTFNPLAIILPFKIRGAEPFLLLGGLLFPG